LRVPDRDAATAVLREVRHQYPPPHLVAFVLQLEFFVAREQIIGVEAQKAPPQRAGQVDLPGNDPPAEA